MKKIMSVYARIDHTHSIYVSLWRCVRGGEGWSHTPVPAADIERDRAWDPQRFSPPVDKKKEKLHRPRANCRIYRWIQRLSPPGE